MSIDMYLGQARSQAASVKSVCNQLSQGYSSLLQSNQQFIGTGELSSKAYDSAKAFFSAVIQPLVQGAEVGAEMTAEACQKFVDQYTSEVDSIDLKSDQLERRIQQVNQSIQNMQHISNNLPSLPLGTNPLKQINQRIIESLETTKRDLEKKLEKLLSFNASSPAIFSEVNAFYGTLAQGLQQANTSFNPSTGTFTIPKGKALDWTKTVQSSYQKSNQKKLDKLMSQPFSTENAIKVYELAQKDSTIKLDKKAIKWFNEHKGDLQGIFVDFSQTTLEEYLKHNGDDLALSIGMMFGTLYNNAPFGSWTSAVNQGLTAGVTSSAKTAFNATTNFLDSTVKSSALGVVVGTGLGMATGDSFGQAFASSAVTTGVSLGVSTIAIAAIGVTPIGLAAIGVAVGVSVVTASLYQKNFLGMKDLSENVGQKIDDGVDWLKKKTDGIGKGMKQVGSVIGDKWNSATSWRW